jgi:hypothetical protein
MPLIVTSGGRVTVSSDVSPLGSMAVAGVLVPGHLSNTGVVLLSSSATQYLLVPSGQMALFDADPVQPGMTW